MWQRAILCVLCEIGRSESAMLSERSTVANIGWPRARRDPRERRRRCPLRSSRRCWPAQFPDAVADAAGSPHDAVAATPQARVSRKRRHLLPRDRVRSTTRRGAPPPLRGAGLLVRLHRLRRRRRARVERRLSVIYARRARRSCARARRARSGRSCSRARGCHDYLHAQLGAGAVLGEMSLFGGGIRNADVVSDRATLAVMSFAELEAFRAAQPALGRRLTTMLARACLGKHLRAESNVYGQPLTLDELPQAELDARLAELHRQQHNLGWAMRSVGATIGGKAEVLYRRAAAAGGLSPRTPASVSRGACSAASSELAAAASSGGRRAGSSGGGSLEDASVGMVTVPAEQRRVAAAISELKSAVEERSERYDEVKQLQGTVQALRLAWAGSDGAVGRELGAPSQVRRHASSHCRVSGCCRRCSHSAASYPSARALTVLRYRGGSVTADGVVADAPAAELAALRAAHAKLLRLLILLDRLRLVPAASLDSPTATASAPPPSTPASAASAAAAARGNGFAVGGSTFESRALADGGASSQLLLPLDSLAATARPRSSGSNTWASRGDGAVAGGECGAPARVRPAARRGPAGAPLGPRRGPPWRRPARRFCAADRRPRVAAALRDAAAPEGAPSLLSPRLSAERVALNSLGSERPPPPSAPHLWRRNASRARSDTRRDGDAAAAADGAARGARALRRDRAVAPSDDGVVVEFERHDARPPRRLAPWYATPPPPPCSPSRQRWRAAA